MKITFVRIDRRLLWGSECRFIDRYLNHYVEPPVTNGQVPGVTRPADYTKEVIKRPSYEDLPDIGSMLPGMVSLAAKPPSSLTGVPGVYFVSIMDPNDPSRPFPLPRIHGTDPLGRLSIGKTLDVAHRIRQIRTNLLGNKIHGEWALFHHIYDLCRPLRRTFGSMDEIVNNLYISYGRTRPSLLDAGERRAFNEYIRQFVEPPPTNCQIPGDIRRKRY